MKTLLLSAAILFILPNFIWVTGKETPKYNNKEIFNPQLSKLNSIHKLTLYADSIAATKGVNSQSFKYALILTGVIKERFYHGFSSYTFQQNWLAALGECVLGHDLSCIVDPEEIMKYPYGGCSQQSMVFIEVMKAKGIDYRSVGFPHHYAIELKYDNDWYFFDPNMEPKIPDEARKESAWKGSGDSLKQYYSRAIYPNLDWAFGSSLQVKRGSINAVPASNAKLFHSVTGFLSKILWIFPLAILYSKNRKRSGYKSLKKYPNLSENLYFVEMRNGNFSQNLSLN